MMHFGTATYGATGEEPDHSNAVESRRVASWEAANQLSSNFRVPS